jgi:hypothetical protein
MLKKIFSAAALVVCMSTTASLSGSAATYDASTSSRIPIVEIGPPNQKTLPVRIVPGHSRAAEQNRWAWGLGLGSEPRLYRWLSAGTAAGMTRDSI